MKVHEGNVMAAQSNAAIPANLDNMSLAAVREYRAGLSEEEEKVSYWRRLAQKRRAPPPLRLLRKANATRLTISLKRRSR